MKRQYVHLSENMVDASKVALRRKGKEIQILRVNSEKAYSNGIKFFQEEGAIWLTNYVPPEFIDML